MSQADAAIEGGRPAPQPDLSGDRVVRFLSTTPGLLRDRPARPDVARAEHRPDVHVAAHAGEPVVGGLVADLLGARAWPHSRTTRRSSRTTRSCRHCGRPSQIAVAGTILPIFVGALGGLRLRLARLPRPRLAVHPRHRPARRAAADVADPDLQPLRHGSASSDSVARPRSSFHTAFGLPFAIFLLRNFFIGIPKTSWRRRESTAPRDQVSSCG